MTAASDSVQLVVPESVELGLVRGSTSKDVVARATETANVLAEVIQSRKLFATISNKRYVRCEGWTTLAALMGFIPREASMTRREDGSYEAVAELVRITDGVVLSRASAECGVGEPTWKARADYARRSMAATRATSKVCRLAFSWVMGLAGFEVTPFEEIPEEERGGSSRQPKRGTEPKEPVAPTPQPLTEKPKALTEEEPMPWEGPTRETLWPGPGPTQGKSVREWASKHLRMAHEGTVKVPEEWLPVIAAEIKARSYKSVIERATLDKPAA